MHPEYEFLYEISNDCSFSSGTQSTNVENFEKRMKDIKKKKITHACDKSWSDKSKISPKIYDNWYSPLNDKTLKIDSVHLSKCDYQDLVDLLFTNGELDADKVICLHVLASHSCDKLVLPSNNNNNNNNNNNKYQAQTALDRLIERSKTFCGYRSGIKYNLPIYIIKLNEQKRQYLSNKNGKKYTTCTKLQDGRLATRLVINEKLWHLIQTVVEALHHCNPSKMVYLLKAAHNINYVRHIINKPQLQSFIKALTTQNIVLSSDSFLLTRPFESCIELKIDNPSVNLELLIEKIRRHVLNDQNYEPQKIVCPENPKKMYQKMRRIKREIDVCLDYCQFDAEKISGILNAKIREVQERDMKKIKRPVTASAVLTATTPRIHQCYACMQKWRKNMLSEELEKKKSVSVTSYKPVNSHSTQWLKLIIQEEENNLKKVKTKHPLKLNKTERDEVIQKRPMVLNINEKKKYSTIKKNRSIELTNPNLRYAENNLNLAKIKNDISVKENKKRIKKFLEEPIYTRKKIFENMYQIL